jgi:transketolase
MPPATKKAKISHDVPAFTIPLQEGFKFPIDLSKYKKVSIDPFTTKELSAEQVADLNANIELCRDAILFFTSCGSGTGYGGHTGGAFDTVPEVMLLDAFFRACPDKFVPTFFDEAGHRVATQYLMSVLEGNFEAERLVDYRRGHSLLPGHPELGMTPGIKFSSGRLGHMWPAVNGVAVANKDKSIFCLGSDGSQMEGNDAEAARLAVSENLNVKLIVDDNDVTITGHPSQYFTGYSVKKTLEGHGLTCVEVPGEGGVTGLYAALRTAITHDGPYAVICKRKMAPGITGVEGSNHGHDAVAPKLAIPYFEKRGNTAAAEYLRGLTKSSDSYGEYKGCGKVGSNRQTGGQAITDMIGKIPAAERTKQVMVIDSDLGGSTAMTKVQDAYPEVYIQSGIMERGNLSAAAGFGMESGKQGITSTFAAFLEMCVSEITMARLNRSNLLCHFSHSGCDDMADNTCHFGINNMFADNGLEDGYDTKLYFPADFHQVRKCTETIFPMPGLRFLFTIRSKTPELLKEDGTPFFGDGYTFVPGKDDVVRKGTAGYVVTFGDCAYRAIDAVDRLRAEGVDVGLIIKCTINVVDEETTKLMGESPFVLVVEPLNRRTGLGSKMGTWLLERGFSPKYKYVGIHKEGSGGLWEHAYHQGYDSKSIQDKIKSLL